MKTQLETQLVTRLAADQGLDPERYWETICWTVIKEKATNEQIIAFLAIAKQYGLNPLTKEIYAFPSGNGISPIVSVDGWLKLANNHPEFDGLETEEIREDGEVIAVRCSAWRKDRTRPTVATEYMSECKRNTEPWKQWPVRMLTNKAMIQALRRAFSFAGIYDQDEGERIKQAADADYQEVDDLSSVAQSATDTKANNLQERLKKESKNAKGQDEPDGTQGAGEEVSGCSPTEAAEPAPDPQEEPVSDFELMDVNDLLAWLHENKRPGNEGDKNLVESCARSGNKETIVKVCQSFADRKGGE